MAIQLPGIQYLRGYDGKADIIGEFAKGYGLTSGIRDEQDAKAALGDYVKSLYMGGSAPAQPPTALSPTLVGDSVNAATGTAPWMESALNESDYLATLRARESGGDNAKNPRSSAAGRYQITDDTWAGLMQQNPELGLTADGRSDPAQQERAVRALTSQNAAALKGKGLPVNPGTLYASHFLGAPQATSLLAYADTTPLVSALPPEVITANPHLQNMTVADFKRWAGGEGGNSNGGYRAPMAPEPAQQTATGLPPRDVMMRLFQNPNTREFAAQLAQAAQKGEDLLPIINAGGGQLYDQSTGQWITAPGSDQPDPVEFSDISGIRKEIQQLPSYKNFAQAQPIYQSMYETAGRDSRASDLNLVYGLGKIMDPTSVVREGEMFMVQGINTLPDKLVEGINSVLTGTSTLSPETRTAILREAYGRMKGYQSALDNDTASYRELAGRYNVNPDDILPKFGSFEEWSPSSGDADLDAILKKYQ